MKHALKLMCKPRRRRNSQQKGWMGGADGLATCVPLGGPRLPPRLMEPA